MCIPPLEGDKAFRVSDRVLVLKSGLLPFDLMWDLLCRCGDSTMPGEHPLQYCP